MNPSKPTQIFSKIAIGCLSIATAESAMSIELTDYTEPVSHYESAYISGQVNVDSGNQDQTSFDVQGNGNYEKIFSSVDRIVSFDVDANLDSSRSGVAGADTQTGYDVFGTAQTREYFDSNSNKFWYGAADLGFRRLQGSGDDDDPFLKVSAGVGMGRITNATPLALVVRVVEVFQEYGVMKTAPTQAIYLELAKVVAQEEEYISKHGAEDYNQFWFQDLEAILVREGLVDGGALNAVAVLKMYQVLVDERISTRAHGWFLQGGVGYIASDYAGEDGDPTLDILFQYAMPYGIKTQFIQEVAYSTVLADDTNQLFSSTSSLTYELSNRIDWENGIDLRLTVFGNDAIPNVFLTEAFSTYRYYLSNRLSTDLTFALSHVNDKVDNNGNDDIEKSLFVGITYRLK
jgi:hypothetical protein